MWEREREREEGGRGRRKRAHLTLIVSKKETSFKNNKIK